MHLDPEVAAYYHEAIVHKAFHLGTTDISLIRQGADMKYNDQDVTTPIGWWQDITIPGDQGNHQVPVPLRLYSPENPTHGVSCEGGCCTLAPATLRPVLLYFHGGGFIMHNIASHDSLCRYLANCGDFVVVSVEYRLAPEHPYPAALEDAWTALRWVAANAATFGGDPTRIILGGDSAGAALAAAVAATANPVNKTCVTVDSTIPIAALFLLYGVYDCVSLDESETVAAFGGGDYVLPKDMLELCETLYYKDSPLSPEALAEDVGLHPGNGDLSHMPLTFICCAACDPLRQDGEVFASRLSEAGVDVRDYPGTGMMHGFALLWESFERAATLLNQMCKDLRKAL